MEQAERIASIDQFRGFSVILMIIANYLLGIATVPPWLKHAPDVGLTVIDLIAPFFIFSIGLTYARSAKKRIAREGSLKSLQHFLVRGLVLIGIGSLLSLGEQWTGVNGSSINWGVLQAIGAAIILSYAAVPLRFGTKLFVAGALLAIYQVVSSFYLQPFILAAPHGGVPGAFAWTAMMILCSALADLFHDPVRRRLHFPLACLATGLAGGLLALFVAVSKNRVSASYVLLATGISGLVFWCFHLLADRRGLAVPLFSDWGVNPLLLYLVQGLLDALFMLPPIAWWYAQAPWYVIVPELLFMLGLMSWIAHALRRKGLIFSL